MPAMLKPPLGLRARTHRRRVLVGGDGPERSWTRRDRAMVHAGGWAGLARAPHGRRRGVWRLGARARAAEPAGDGARAGRRPVGLERELRHRVGSGRRGAAILAVELALCGGERGRGRALVAPCSHVEGLPSALSIALKVKGQPSRGRLCVKVCACHVCTGLCSSTQKENGLRAPIASPGADCSSAYARACLDAHLAPHPVLHVLEEGLLRPDDGSGAAEPQPAEHLCHCQLEVLHDVERDQGARPAEPSLAVDGQGARLGLRNVEEALDDRVGRVAAVWEVEVVVVEACGRGAERARRLRAEPKNGDRPTLPSKAEAMQSPKMGETKKRPAARLKRQRQRLNGGTASTAGQSVGEATGVRSCVDEFLAVVHLVVEAHDAGDMIRAEVLVVRLGSVGLDAVDIGNGRLRRPREGEELARHDPVEVAILDALVVLVGFDVELVGVEPAELARLAQPSEAVQHRQVEERLPHRGVAVRAERRPQPRERLPRLLGRLVVVQHLPRGEQQHRVSARVMLRSAAVHHLLVRLGAV
eukprot:6181307-Pleurochrysis_carterae.AAC.3